MTDETQKHGAVKESIVAGDEVKLANEGAKDGENGALAMIEKECDTKLPPTPTASAEDEEAEVVEDGEKSVNEVEKDGEDDDRAEDKSTDELPQTPTSSEGDSEHKYEVVEANSTLNASKDNEESWNEKEKNIENEARAEDSKLPQVAPNCEISNSKSDAHDVETNAAPAAGIENYHDHFTLSAPSSTIRFRASNTTSRVYESKYSQFIIEQDKDGKVTTKRMVSGNSGLQFLRAVYTLVVLFWTGFLVVFCVQVLLFLIQDLTIQVGATSKQAADVGQALGTILSLPIYIHGLASALVIAGHYAIDTWGGFHLIKNFVFGNWSIVVTSWLTFSFFLGIPLFIMAVCLLVGTDDWWAITSLSWFSFVAAFYVFFAMTVVIFEVNACLEIIKNQFDDDDDGFWSLLKRSILLRQVNRYSGRNQKVYIARGELEDATGVCKHVDESNARFETGWYARFTLWKIWTKWGLFIPLEEPGERIYTVDDAQGIRPFITRASWSLEKLYCRPKNSRYVAVIQGPAALTRAQLRSSFVCALLGNFLIFLLLVAFLVYLGIGGGFVAIICILVAIFWVPNLLSSYRIWVLTKDIVGVKKEKDEEEMTVTTDDESERGEGGSEGVFQVWESNRVSRATERLCWIMFGLEWALLFVYPMITLFAVKNYQLAVLFVIIGAFSAVRYYLNAPVVLEEVGHMRFVLGENEREQWKNRSRLYDVITHVSRSRSRGAWNAVLSVFIFIFLALFLGAVGQGSDSSSTQQFTYLPNHGYIQQEDLRYPTCVLGKEIEGGPSTQAMADYAYLAGLAYRDTSITQGELDQWFGNDTALDMPDFVTAFRERNAATDSAVSYKLIAFPNATAQGEDYAIVSIRGTTNAWDMLADAQLWSAAACMQLLRAILPLGEAWTPILSQLVNAISFFESANIERVSFYKQTTAFVKDLQESGIFKSIQVTGHSLGGGLAIITGAQTGAAAVALSGPNAMISRRTFDGAFRLMWRFV